MKHLLGIDIGTTGVKTIVLRQDGRIAGSSLKEYPMSTPRPGWAEQDPVDWWRGTVDGIKAALKSSKVPASSIAGIGLSGQMHGSVFLDKNSRVIRPCILWCDQRTAKECAIITRTIGPERLIKLAGNPALTGFTAPKILWLRDNEPKAYAKISKFLLPKDYIRLLLTGRFATEVSDASGTLLLDVRNRKWSTEILDGLKIPMSWMPECVESTIATGSITKEASRLTGLLEGTPVFGGGGDQAAQAVGLGITEPGAVSINIGTSGVVFAACDRPMFDPKGRVHSFCHAIPGKWHIMGVMLAAGGSLRWWRDALCHEEVAEAKKRKVAPYEIIIDRASKVPAGAEGLIFLPYLSGERTPHANPHARGVFIGLSLSHTKAHMARAVLEGVCFGLRDSLEIIKSMGIPVRQIRLTGGGARSKAWSQMLADVLGEKICIVEPAEGSAYGAGMIAAIGAGAFKDADEASRRTAKVRQRLVPYPANTAAYERQYKKFKKLYTAVKTEFKD